MTYDYVAIPIAEGHQTPGVERTSNLMQQMKDQGKKGFHFVRIFKMPARDNEEYMLMEQEFTGPVQ